MDPKEIRIVLLDGVITITPEMVQAGSMELGHYHPDGGGETSEDTVINILRAVLTGAAVEMGSRKQ